jgi:hypothetical protein
VQGTNGIDDLFHPVNTSSVFDGRLVEFVHGENDASLEPTQPKRDPRRFSARGSRAMARHLSPAAVNPSAGAVR